MRNLEEAEAKYLDVLRKTRPDLAEQVRRPQRKERRPPKMEWRPKQTKADEKPSAVVNMVFVLPSGTPTGGSACCTVGSWPPADHL